jgi:hypothetical protein
MAVRGRGVPQNEHVPCPPPPRGYLAETFLFGFRLGDGIFESAVSSRLAQSVVLLTFALRVSVSPAAEPAKSPARDRAPQDVVVFASTHEAKGFPRPTPAQPAYYLAMAGGYHAEGPQRGRDNAETVTADSVWPALEKTLAAQGYLRATKDTPPPSLLIVFHWGTMSPDVVEVADGQPLIVNEKNVGNLVGVTRVDRHLESEFGQVYHNATEPRYLIIVTAFDYAQATAKQRQKVVIWRTRLSVPMQGTTLPDAIVPMLVTGAPFFGRDSGQPKEIRWDAGKVEIGEARVVEPAAAPAPKK